MSKLSRKIKDELIEKAKQRSGDNITAIRINKTIVSDFGFTITDIGGLDYAIFWYNTPDASTHIVKKRLD